MSSPVQAQIIVSSSYYPSPSPMDRKNQLHMSQLNSPVVAVAMEQHGNEDYFSHVSNTSFTEDAVEISGNFFSQVL